MAAYDKPKGRKGPRLGASLPLAKFGAAKASSYDKKEQRERTTALNAGKVNKYRKLKSRLEIAGRLQPLFYKSEQDTNNREQDGHAPTEQGGSAPTSVIAKEAAPGAGSSGARLRPPQSDADEPAAVPGEKKRKQRTHKPVPTVEYIAAAVRSSKESENAAKAAAKEAAQSVQRRKAEAEKRRKTQSVHFRKKTKSGQPVMAYRVNKILDQLEAGK